MNSLRQVETPIAARIGSANRHTTFVFTWVLSSIVAVALLIWFAAMIVGGVLLAVSAFGFRVVGVHVEHRAEDGVLLAIFPFGFRVAAGGPENFATPQMVAAAAIIVISTLLATLAARRLLPAAPLIVAFSMSALTLLVAAFNTRSLSSLLVPIAFIFLSWLLGDVTLRRLRLPDCPVIIRVPVATAVGLGLLGLFLFLLATLALLNSATVVVAASLLLVALFAIERQRLRADLLRLRSWRPEPPTWFETVIVGLAAGLVAFAMLAAFVPDVMGSASDAMRQHLPIAREIWQTGSITEFPQLFASRQPIQGHLFHAVAYGLGGVTAAKLLQTLVGLIAILGVAAIGWLAAGRVAATTSAVIFATIPLSMWIVGHLFPDLFAVLFTATAAVCVLLWMRDNRVAWLAVAGALLGFGLATKVAMVLLILAFGAGVFLVGRSPWRWRERIVAAGAFALGTLVVVPWLARSFAITGSFPGLSTIQNKVTDFIQGSSAALEPAGEGFVTVAPHVGGVGHSPLDLLLGPWTLTFDGAPRNYRVIMEGEFGIALLMLLPLALLSPRTRTKAFLALTAAISYLGWAISDQVPRHLLPSIVLVAALAGIGVANALSTANNRPRQILATAARTGLVFSCLAALLYFLPNHTTRLPVDLILGRETAAEYIEQEVWAITSLRAANDLLPPDTRVGYIGLWEGPQAYTEVRLVFLGTYSIDDANYLDNQLGTTPEEVLASLERWELKYFIWDRPNTRLEDWSSTLLSGDFLREHTRILAGDRDAYLFEVLPEGGQSWGMTDPENLLQDPDFRRIRRENGPWTISGKITKNEGALTLRRDATVKQQVPVSGGDPYLLVASVKCPDPKLRTTLTLRWLDADGATIAVAAEDVQPGVAVNDQFLWRLAPEQAAFASVELGDGGGARCEYSEIGLFAAPTSEEPRDD